MADEKPKKKYLDKYDSEEELVKAYQNLESKLGEQGASLGQQKQALEQYAAAFQQYQQAVSQMQPVYQWVVQNQPALQQFAAFLQRGGSVQQAAGAAAQQTPGYELLTPTEKNALKVEFAREFQQHLLAPTMQRFEQGFRQAADQYMAQMRNEMAQQTRASTEVLYNIAQRIAPQDRWAEVQEELAETVRFADPRTFDPQQMASDHLKLRREFNAAKTKMEQYEKDQAERERTGTGSFGSGTSPSIFREEGKAPANVDERRAQTLSAFKADVGREAANDFFRGAR